MDFAFTLPGRHSRTLRSDCKVTGPGGSTIFRLCKCQKLLICGLPFGGCTMDRVWICRFSCTNVWREQIDEFLVLQAASDKLLAGHLAVRVDVHPSKDALSARLRTLECVLRHLFRAFWILAGFYNNKLKVVNRGAFWAGFDGGGWLKQHTSPHEKG